MSNSSENAYGLNNVIFVKRASHLYSWLQLLWVPVWCQGYRRETGNRFSGGLIFIRSIYVWSNRLARIKLYVKSYNAGTWKRSIPACKRNGYKQVWNCFPRWVCLPPQWPPALRQERLSSRQVQASGSCWRRKAWRACRPATTQMATTTWGCRTQAAWNRHPWSTPRLTRARWPVWPTPALWWVPCPCPRQGYSSRWCKLFFVINFLVKRKCSLNKK